MKRLMLPLGPLLRTNNPSSQNSALHREGQEQPLKGNAHPGEVLVEGSVACWEPATEQPLIVSVVKSLEGGSSDACGGGSYPGAAGPSTGIDPNAPLPFTVADGALKALQTALLVATAVGGVSGLCAAVLQIDRAVGLGEGVSSRQLVGSVTQVVASTVAGTLAGTVLGPLHAARAMAGVLARPVVAGVIVHRVVAWARRRLSGALALIKKMQSDDFLAQLEAVRSVLAQALKNDKFRREFSKLGGVERLVRLLSESLSQLKAGSPLVVVLAHALEALLAGSAECRDAFVAAGGVGALVRLLGTRPAHGGCAACVPADAAVGHALGALSTLSDHAAAQEAIRECGGLAVLVSAAAAARPTSPNALAAVTLLQSLALDPANKEELGRAGGVSVLLGTAQVAPAGSQLQCAAVTALHSLMRGSPPNQRALAAVPGAASTLSEALSEVGPYWQPCRTDLHALVNVLGRFPKASPCHQALPQAPAAAVAPTAAAVASGAKCCVGSPGLDTPPRHKSGVSSSRSSDTGAPSSSADGGDVSAPGGGAGVEELGSPCGGDFIGVSAEEATESAQ